MNEHSLELTTALTAVEIACTLCRQMQRQRAIKSIDKDARSPVTVADFASQAIICHTLTGAFPFDPIIGEESSNLSNTGKKPSDDRCTARRGAVYFWDITRGFMTWQRKSGHKVKSVQDALRRCSHGESGTQKIHGRIQERGRQTGHGPGVQNSRGSQESRATYGSRRMARELKTLVFRCGKHKAGTDSNHRLPVAPNLLNRRFSVTTPN